MGQPSVTKELRRRRSRRRKLNKFRKLLATAAGEFDKKKIWQKVIKIAPWLSMKDFIGG
ncbi:MAG: DUF6800 family protein [Patescibacteria group bacterium]